MQCMGTSYEGCELNGRMDDPDAIYTFPSYFASEYHGGFQDGMFQGEGKLKFPGGVNYIGKFEKGKAVEGYFEFADGLRMEMDIWNYCDGDVDRVFKSEDENGIKPGYFEFADGLRMEMDIWNYCDGDVDRVFKSEDENGIKPAGRSQLTNQDPPQTIPEGMYDCGDGFYDPVTRKVVNYDFVFLRNTDEKEHNWIINHCRKAWDEPVGTRKIH
ncbi:MORN repeat-containing protein 5-like [Orbicella faveolata]|uniref:MORN repeat-containing protein 5-like n=1 Tax=Orbicella faveolata TaxID=48498 RepID=UPI0009E4DA96|nr:MORN repeat-containing protein 5-like [Orbicella faveolata]